MTQDCEWKDSPEPNEYECPHCNQSYEATDIEAYADDVRDECFETCVVCGYQFQLQCVSVDHWFRVRRLAKEAGPQSVPPAPEVKE